MRWSYRELARHLGEMGDRVFHLAATPFEPPQIPIPPGPPFGVSYEEWGSLWGTLQNLVNLVYYRGMLDGFLLGAILVLVLTPKQRD